MILNKNPEKWYETWKNGQASSPLSFCFLSGCWNNAATLQIDVIDQKKGKFYSGVLWKKSIYVSRYSFKRTCKSLSVRLMYKITGKSWQNHGSLSVQKKWESCMSGKVNQNSWQRAVLEIIAFLQILTSISRKMVWSIYNLKCRISADLTVVK